MGTRNLTMVILGGKTKVAQYGQWDGGPEGQGVTALEFLRGADLNHFKAQLKKVKFVTKKKQKEINEWLKSIGAGSGWMNGEQASKYHAKYPLLTRDHGAAVLELIDMLETDTDNWLHNQESFAADSLFCEWAYVIDFDKGTFEVYRGFQNEPLPEGDRFKPLEAKMKMRTVEELAAGREQYYPVKHLISFGLNNLPTEDGFLEQVGEKLPKDEDEEDEQTETK